MNPQEIRRKILEVLYENRAQFSLGTQKIVDSFMPQLDEAVLHQEIEYLKNKYLLEIQGEYMGKEYLNFFGLKITSYGVDEIENTDDNKLIHINLAHFGDVSNSNIVANNSQAKQTLNIEQLEISPEIRVILEQLKEAVEKKDVETSNLLLEKLKSGAESVFWNLVASGLMYVMSK